jgi:two-component system sensor histidine kinase HydH
MSERQRRFAWWVGKGAVAMAALAALSLALTVILAARALEHAADVVALGDGEAVVADVVVDLWRADAKLTPETLAAMLAKHEPQGLRYLALVDRKEHHVIVEAGRAELSRTDFLPGTVSRHGDRARLVAIIPPRADTRVASEAGHGPPDLSPDPRPEIVVELESPLIARFQGDLVRIGVVATVAAFVLVMFAFAWSRTNARLAIERERTESERRFVALGGASSIIAHEIRNPLASLKGHAQLLVEDLQEPQRAKAMRVVAGAERLEHLTSVLIDFVRDAPLSVRAMKTSELVERAIGPIIKERVRVDLTDAPDVLDVDERFVLALRNVVANAYQVTREADEAPLVRVTREGTSTVIEVRDHGPGVPGGSEEAIFEPFMTTKTKGTGLGLSIARRIVEQHHGTLVGGTHAEGGAMFRFVIPG